MSVTDSVRGKTIVLLMFAAMGAAVFAVPSPIEPAWSFSYGGKDYDAIPPNWPTEVRQGVLDDGARVRRTTLAREPETGLELSVVETSYRDLPIIEWSLAFENRGTTDTARFTRIDSGDFDLHFEPSANISIWKGIGEMRCKPENEHLNYSFATYRLCPGSIERFVTSEGYPSLKTFPYFRVFSESHGYSVAVGWQGAWYGEVSATNGVAHVTARQESVDFYLKPGEKVIAPTVTVLSYENHDDAVNQWRRFMRRWILPRDRNGRDPIRPILCINGHESGHLYSSITCDRQLELLHIMRNEKKLDFDGWWIDAGWYVPLGAKGPKGKPKTWHESVGLWRPDPARFPADGFKSLSGELAKGGAELFLWHEPERVHECSEFYADARPYLAPSDVATLDRVEYRKMHRYDLTNPKALEFITDIIVGSIVTNGVGFYREDSNGPGPAHYWPYIDAARKDGRRGIAENLSIQAHFRMWEAFRRAKPGLRFDICASGGRRNDLSTLRFPSVPLHYSDLGYWNFREKQHYQHMMNEWLFYRKNIAWAFHPPKTKGFIDRRHAVIDFAPMHMVRTVIFLNPARNERGISHEEEERQLISVWRRCAPTMIDGDYYLLTSERFGDDTWWVTEFYDPQKNSGFMQVVRNPDNRDASIRVVPRGVRKFGRYKVRDAFTGDETAFEGGGTLELRLSADSGTILEFCE